jgi:uncharacterized coiled-coil protein SlyX
MLERFRRRPRSIDGSYERRLEQLESRVSDLGDPLEGLQDAVYRESVRRDDEALQLRRQLAPREMARALSEDARKRGLE